MDFFVVVVGFWEQAPKTQLLYKKFHTNPFGTSSGQRAIIRPSVRGQCFQASEASKVSRPPRPPGPQGPPGKKFVKVGYHNENVKVGYFGRWGIVKVGVLSRVGYC